MFKTVSSITAFIALALCASLFFVPEFIFLLFNVEGNNSAFFISRRAAVLFLGISVLCWTGRNAVHSGSRQAICLGLGISMSSLALLGVVEYFRDYAGAGITLAVVTEASLGIVYLKIWLNNKIFNKEIHDG